MINYGLKYKVSDISRILKVDKNLVKDWSYHFADYLSQKANPEKGKEREYTTKDICTLGYVSYHWEENPDFEDIKYGLNRGDQFEYPFTEMAKEAIPIFREYSDEILTQNVWMIGGILDNSDILDLANSYKKAGDILFNVGIKDEQDKEFIYPAIFTYRHSTELYLKAILLEHKKTHRLKDLYSDFKVLMLEKFNEEIPSWFENIIIAFDEFDPKGISFRYGNETYGDELFVDLGHIKEMMDWFAESIYKIKKAL